MSSPKPVSVWRFIDSKLIIFLLTIVFSSGIGWSMLNAQAQDIAETVEELDGLSTVINQHTHGNGHQLTGAKLEEMERRIGNLEITIEKISTSQAAQDRALAAICAATGARCP